MKKKLILTAAAAVFAFGIAAPTQAATEYTTNNVSYYTITWNGHQWKVPVYTFYFGHAGQTDQPQAPAQKPSTQAPAKQTPQGPAQPTAPAPVQSQPTAPAQEASTEVQQVLDLVNAERAKAGLSPVTLNAELSRMATIKAEDMRDNHYFSHESPTYGSPFDMMSSFGIKYSYAGENIAAGQKTPDEVMKGWMNSPGHKANILNEHYTQIGIGVAKGGSYGTYWVQSFLRP